MSLFAKYMAARTTQRLESNRLAPPGCSTNQSQRYFGCGTMRMYGSGDFQPSG